MGRHIIEVLGKTSKEIKEMFGTDKKSKQFLRLCAVYQVSLGKKPQDLEEFYDTSFKSINNWVHRFNNEGIEGLIDKQIPGRKPKLSESDKQELKRTVLYDTPESHGFNSATWTGPMLVIYVENKYGVTYKKAQIYNILKKQNLTFQKGKGIYLESNTEKREEIVEELKKTSK